jgi:hypothetical protein
MYSDSEKRVSASFRSASGQDAQRKLYILLTWPFGTSVVKMVYENDHGIDKV